MRRFGFWMLSLLMISLFLNGCGGGGGGTTGGGGGTTPTPTVSAFSIPPTATSLTVAVSVFTIADADSYLITGSSTAPLAINAGWSTTKPATFTFAAAGSQTAYAWAKNSAGTVSQSISATVTITLPTVVARQVTGKVIDPTSNNTGIPATVVNAYVQPSVAGAPPVATATVQGFDGNFTITGLLDGQTYYFTFVRGNNYTTVTYYNIAPSAAADTVLEDVKLMPNFTNPTDTISGYIRNAANNGGVSGLTIKLRAGINPPATDPVLFTTTTGSNGVYTFTLVPYGTYTAEVTGNIGGTAITATKFRVYSYIGSPTEQDALVTTGINLSTDKYRAVLSWGNTPADLDLHLTGPLAPGDTTTTIGEDITPLSRFHIGPYSAQINNAAYPYGSEIALAPTIPGPTTDSYLEMDQASHGNYNGSETMTILNQRTGTYKFYVSNNSADNSELAASGAQVKIYKGAVLVQTFNVPAGTGNIWSVCTLTTDTFVTVNTISTAFTYNLTKRVTGSFDEHFLFKNLPIKK